jgi:8-oxo-dGTP diphosphatase
MPTGRLGTAHSSLSQFRQAAFENFSPSSSKEYSLVVVTESAKTRILLGVKHRGFGKGMYNSFGGKLEKGESDVQSACRELQEEAGIVVPVERMANSKIGIMRYTFVDDPVEMVVHVFHVNVTCDPANPDESSSSLSASLSSIFLDPSTVRGCDEITPFWVENYYDIPLDNMFADDSVWLTYLLASNDSNVTVNGWFHFIAGGQETNEVMHYFVDPGLKNRRTSS